MRRSITGPSATLDTPDVPATVLRGGERQTMLPQLRAVQNGPEDEVLYEDDLGQPWVDRPGLAGRELVRIGWREVCLNWSDALCNGEADNKN